MTSSVDRQPLNPATFSAVTTFTGTITDFWTFSPSAALTALRTAILPGSAGYCATDAYSVPPSTAFSPSAVPSKPMPAGLGLHPLPVDHPELRRLG